MRIHALAAASLLAVISSAQAAQPGREERDTMRENRIRATADARNIARGTREGRAANCIIFLNLSTYTHHARQVGFSVARIRQAHDAYYADLRRWLGEQGAGQLVASSGNPLEPALPSARDAASRWCVQHAPARRGRRG